MRGLCVRSYWCVSGLGGVKACAEGIWCVAEVLRTRTGYGTNRHFDLWPSGASMYAHTDTLAPWSDKTVG